MKAENPDYLSKQLITYLGNKRALLDFIGSGLDRVAARLGRPLSGGAGLDLFDVFSGSGAVSRFFRRYARRLVANDLEPYAEVINRCYLANRSGLDLPALRERHATLLAALSTEQLEGGIVAELYAPADDEAILAGERVFYTRRNAMYLDSARRLIGSLPAGERAFFLGPLLAEASVHANTAGVFKGFYKNRDTGVGMFGGRQGDALSRIRGDIVLPFPVFSDFECEVEIHRGDSGEVVAKVAEVDVAYLDPPYNQHPYGSNYFMLNMLVDYERPVVISEVSGIPKDWRRSDWNSVPRVREALRNLVADLGAKFIMLSFNSEGFIAEAEMRSLLEGFGRLEVLETGYNAFKGSRNLRGRATHVKESLYILEKS